MTDGPAPYRPLCWPQLHVDVPPAGAIVYHALSRVSSLLDVEDSVEEEVAEPPVGDCVYDGVQGDVQGEDLYLEDEEPGWDGVREHGKQHLYDEGRPGDYEGPADYCYRQNCHPRETASHPLAVSYRDVEKINVADYDHHQRESHQQDAAGHG